MNNTLPTTSWTELKRVLGLNLDEVKQEPRRRSANSAATITDLMQVVCSDGERTEHMMKLIGALIASNMSDQQCLARCHEWNARNQPPLPEEKISLTFASIRRSDRQNHPDKYPDLLAQVPLLKLADGRIDRYVTTIPLQRRWLIKDLVVLGKVGAVVAPGGSSKSQWLLQLGASIATGVDLAGHWKVGETGGVLMLCAEDDVDEIHRRIHRIRNRMAQLGQGGLLPKLIENLFVFSTIGVETLLTKRQTTGEVEASINIDLLTPTEN